MPDASDYFRGYARDTGVAPTVNGYDNVQDVLENLPGAPTGVPIVRAFSYAYDTAGILTGAPLYVPTVGDLFLDATLLITTAWDGATPRGDVGQFVGNNFGYYGDFLYPIDMAVASVDNIGTGAIQTVPPLSTTSALAVVMSNLETSGAVAPTDAQTLILNAGLAAIAAGTGSVPARFTTTDPIRVCVSQDGTNTGDDPGSTQGAAVLYVVTCTPA